MPDKELYVQLSASGMKKAGKWIERYAKDIERKANQLLAAMLKEGEDYAINALVRIDTGATLNSIMGYREGNSGILTVGGAAIWIEFGTGVTHNGDGYNHPKAAEVGMNQHGTYGLRKGADPNGWYYYTEDGYEHTWGIPSNPFFYNTAQMLRKEYARIAKEVFG